MGKTVMQFRYYNDADTKNNFPTGSNGISYARLASGSIFFDNGLGGIVQLGIQALPGTKFYINNSVNPVIVGYTGIYELDLQSLATEITALSFDESSLKNIKEINGAYLIVDAIYDSGD